ncbi:MAG: hypothetical protein M1828_002888 [Chrysothrix sp. TS-e1954]|nr:MAG: hypothetical protein M1828_002888 [Chrysothrix sp. TS-e1954]
MDYSRLQESTLGSGQDEEAVTVNTRALIDKVLARYSGEWTTLRELIQNAADASASKVVIRFETLPSHNVPTPQSNDATARLKHIVLHHTLRRVLVSNDGQPFAENDWARLRRIAEGNPDETKIGAFGVGFYSVFSECETPFVASGKESMAFYWKGNSLFTRKGTLPDSQSTETCFMLEYRNNTTSVPNLMSICQFLSTSLTFVGLERLELWLDDWNLFRLSKKTAPSTPIPIPRGLNTKTKEGMMRITDVESQNAQIDAMWINVVGWTPVDISQGTPEAPTGGKSASAPSLRTFFSRLAGSAQSSAAAKAAKDEEAAQQMITENIDGISQATVFIRVNSIYIRSHVSKSFANELERATKKPPPKTTKVAILTSSYDETAASLSTLTGASSTKVAEILMSVLPSRSGRIFIGFPTQQTTGVLAHISAPSLIPTVERESIDLNARYVKTWNTELLSVAGIACRIAFAGEMSTLRQRSCSSGAQVGQPTEKRVDELIPSAAHVLKQYTFREATPLALAGSIIEEAFWTCSAHGSIEILSSRGVLPSHEVRIAAENLSFVSGIPVVPEKLKEQACDFITRLRDVGLLTEMTTSDIKQELEKQALDESQLEELLKWVARKLKTSSMDPEMVRTLLVGTVVALVSQETGPLRPSILALGDIKTFVNTARISSDLPVPSDTIPHRFTKALGIAELLKFGWEELQIVPWLRFLLDARYRSSVPPDQELSSSPAFAGQVLVVVSKSWDNLSQSSKNSVVDLLRNETVIPTKQGMKKPADAYFPSVRLFDDLPVYTNLHSVKEKFLKSLGVRKTIELSVIFERLMNEKLEKRADSRPSWSHVDLIRYLVSVCNDIPEDDIFLLRKTPLCPAEEQDDKSTATPQRFLVSELFEPKDSLRDLNLRLLQWPGHLNAYASDGKFLKSLGLRPYPSVPELINILNQAGRNHNIALYEKGLHYFVENNYQNNYKAFDLSGIEIPFVPIETSEQLALVKPEHCFSDRTSQVLGYRVLRQDMQSHADKLGVRTHPPMLDCAASVIRDPPTKRSRAKQVFGYMASRQADMLPNIADRLGSAAIVPIFAKTSSTQEKATPPRLVSPSSCFLGDGMEYGEIFDYVDFGQDANLFLLRVGCKHEPSTIELTKMITREPARILEALGIDKYLGLLRKLHLNMATLKRDKVLWKDMKRLPFLLAYNEKPMDSPGAGLDDSKLEPYDDDSTFVKHYQLTSAATIVILDDYLSYAPFKRHITVAPQEETIEELYYALGAHSVSSLVEEEPRLGSRRSDQREAEKLLELILERSRLFLHDHSAEATRHDVKWLEQNLELQTVQSISVRRSLRGHNVAQLEKRTATLMPGAKSRVCLCITSDYDTWEVSQVMAHILLYRPRPKDISMFETLLNTSLPKLKTRGYNVDRILRKRQAEEARLAELDKQKRCEEEQQRAQHTLQALPAGGQQPKQTGHVPDTVTKGGDAAGITKMPGSFHDSPDRPTHTAAADPPVKPARGFLSQLSRQLGIEGRQPIAQDLQRMLGGNNGTQRLGSHEGSETSRPNIGADKPPPYSQYDPAQVRGPSQPEAVTAPSNVQQNLSSALAASRAHDSNSLVARAETKVVKEMASYCDAHAAQSLRLISTSAPGLKVFTEASILDPTDFVAANAEGLDAFAALLVGTTQIFGIAKDTLHLYYDFAGHTIAFNSGGSIFCNFRYFAQLHLAGIQDAHGRAQALIYWWVVLCHELAHNLVADHSSNHSFYAEQFVIEYFPSAMALINQMASKTLASPQASTNGSNRALTGVEQAFS